MPHVPSHVRFVARLLLAGALFSACLQAAEKTRDPAETLVERATLAMRTDPEASRREAEAALEALKRQPNADIEIRARLLLCDYYSERERAAAEQQIAAAKALLPQAKRQSLRSGVLDCEGEVFETVGDNAQARKLYEQAVQVAAEAHDDEMLADALFSRGYLLGLQGEYAAGLADLQRSQALFEQLKKSQHALTTLNSIATLYNRMGDFSQAQHIYERALKAQRAAGMRREQAVTLQNLARTHENLEEWSAARDAFTEALDISRELNYPRAEAYALRGLAAVANAAHEPKTALQTLERAIALQKETPDARLNAQIDLARGIALRQLHRSTESIAALEHALQIFKEAGSLNELSSTYKELAEAHAAANNWQKAYEYRSEAQKASDQALRNQLDQRFATLKVEFDTATKEKENASLLRENAANQKALAEGRLTRRLQGAVIGLTLVLIGLLITLAVHQRRSTLRMRSLAMTDELTGVPNRRAALARLELQLQNTKGCSLLIIDIDHFKSINDQHGHPVGDQVLKLVTGKLRELVREPAFIGRLGGEEFLIALPGLGLKQAHAAAERFRNEIMSVDLAPWLQRKITVSIGATAANDGEKKSSGLLQRADIALYSAKRNGRNCVQTEPALEPDSDSQVA